MKLKKKTPQHTLRKAEAGAQVSIPLLSMGLCPAKVFVHTELRWFPQVDYVLSWACKSIREGSVLFPRMLKLAPHFSSIYSNPVQFQIPVGSVSNQMWDL